MVDCPKCGTEAREEANYCSSCGKELPERHQETRIVTTPGFLPPDLRSALKDCHKSEREITDREHQLIRKKLSEAMVDMGYILVTVGKIEFIECIDFSNDVFDEMKSRDFEVNEGNFDQIIRFYGILFMMGSLYSAHGDRLLRLAEAAGEREWAKLTPG